MSSFGAKGLTNKGRVLQAKAQAGTQLKYTKYVLGDAQLGGQSIATLNGVISPKKTVDVTRLWMNPPNQATIGFVLSNQDVTTGFYFRELGLYALDPDEGEILYWYANAGDTADYIPPTNTGDVISKTIDMLVYVGTASNVTLTIDQNLAYVTHDELAAALEGLDPEIPGASLTQPGIVQLSNATNGTRENVAATEKAVGQAFQAGNERKAEVVAALVAIGIPASTSETWAQLIPKIAAVIRATGNATAADILAGKTASNANGPLTGSMPNRGAVLITPGPSDQAILAGYHSGAGKVAGVPVPAANVLTGTTIAGTAGTMPNRSSENEHMPGSASTVWPGDRFFIQPPNGYYNGSTWVTALVPGLTPANLRNGVNVAGMVGTLIEGKRSASGTGTSSSGNDASNWMRFDSPTGYWKNSYFLQVAGLIFSPSILILLGGTSSSSIKAVFTIYYRDMQLNGTPNANIIVGDLWTGYQPTNSYVYLSSGNAYVNSTGFRLPVNYGNGTFTWIAIE
ncbi:tail fiber protein [Paenibacillus glucanolyticus]|uniref:tail fiber protein n=1 Tax=Paenibacillus glucanolyticus TaxID=59843 RepID=UPI00128B8963|nr:tail fiber protein [Paenibacillus glucanolyticus]MCA4755528.1 tail fiber protein [Mycolicibacterium fortuitum]MPY20653.1 hypothetical protein [Paenibacillus glucanolyticus]